jgi:hypothetical protein
MARLSWLFGLVVIAAASGCSICCTPWDYAYPAYGGKWERTDRFRGRVGSAFDPAGPFPADQDAALHDPTSAALPERPHDEDSPPPPGAELPEPSTPMPETESQTTFE